MTDKYASERGHPPGPRCGSYSLLFDAYYLKLHVNGQVSQAWHARSGKKSGNIFDYSRERQRLPFEGPIPEGEYWVQPNEIKYLIFPSNAWGSSRITIHVKPGTIVHSRGGFFIHGGKTFGSAGCIDLAYGMESFAERLRRIAPMQGARTKPNNCHIPLTVKYGVTKLGDP